MTSFAFILGCAATLFRKRRRKARAALGGNGHRRWHVVLDHSQFVLYPCALRDS